MCVHIFPPFDYQMVSGEVRVLMCVKRYVCMDVWM